MNALENVKYHELIIDKMVLALKYDVDTNIKNLRYIISVICNCYISNTYQRLSQEAFLIELLDFYESVASMSSSETNEAWMLKHFSEIWKRYKTWIYSCFRCSKRLNENTEEASDDYKELFSSHVKNPTFFMELDEGTRHSGENEFLFRMEEVLKWVKDEVCKDHPIPLMDMNFEGFKNASKHIKDIINRGTGKSAAVTPIMQICMDILSLFVYSSFRIERSNGSKNEESSPVRMANKIFELMELMKETFSGLGWDELKEDRDLISSYNQDLLKFFGDVVDGIHLESSMISKGIYREMYSMCKYLTRDLVERNDEKAKTLTSCVNGDDVIYIVNKNNPEAIHELGRTLESYTQDVLESKIPQTLTTKYMGKRTDWLNQFSLLCSNMGAIPSEIPQMVDAMKDQMFLYADQNTSVIKDVFILGMTHISTRNHNDKLSFLGNCFSAPESVDFPSLRQRIILRLGLQSLVNDGDDDILNQLLYYSFPSPKSFTLPETWDRHPSKYAYEFRYPGGINIIHLPDGITKFITSEQCLMALLHTQNCKFPGREEDDRENAIIWGQVIEIISRATCSGLNDVGMLANESLILATAGMIYFSINALKAHEAMNIDILVKSIVEQERIISDLMKARLIKNREMMVVSYHFNPDLVIPTRGDAPKIQTVIDVPYYKKDIAVIEEETEPEESEDEEGVTELVNESALEEGLGEPELGGNFLGDEDARTI